ncbi:hypothetical protein [Pleomorphomonas oryzae]|uniref:hypothetical protein n=1 Tax=Pleomorphomonas oryzae TaxID=261934 RepID=UPI00041A3D79|nr:hypothetical protein [Pleomorphomonas oryzae]
MATTGWARADGFYDQGDGQRRPAQAELSPDGLAIVAADGTPIARWKLADLIRTMVPDGFRINDRRQAGEFVFDPGTGHDLVLGLARIPEADAPVTPQTLIRTMVMMVAVVLAALFGLAWGLFWMIGSP